MRGAIVGFGTIAMGHLAGYEHVRDLSVVAVADPSPARRQHAEQACGLRGYPGLAELLAREQPDFIDICTPPSTHGELSALGLASGVHVLCEKPVFMPGEAGFPDLLAAIQDSDRVFYPCHVYKFAPVLHSMRGLISAPGFGEVLGASFRTLRRGHAVGVPEWRPHWRREQGISRGGILRDHGPHSIYLATDLTGRTPVAVSCLTGRMSGGPYDTEDTALLRVRCEDDVEISLTLSWACGHRSTTYSIIGGSGAVTVDGDRLTCSIGGQVTRTVIASGFDDPSHRTWFGPMLADFAATVDDPGRQAALVREALMTSLVIEGAYQSAAAAGAWVDVPEPAVPAAG